jgi:opacity protein-like surface antigen
MMKKILLAGMLLAGSNVFAFDTNKLYVGVGTVSISETTDISTAGASASFSEDVKSTPIKIGYIYGSDNRFEFTLDNRDNETSGWNMDWQFVYPSTTSKLAPYWTIGFGSYTADNTAQFLVGNDDLKAFSINLGVGGLYEINNNLELEAALKYKSMKWQDIIVGANTIETTSSGAGLYLGLNYKF